MKAKIVQISLLLLSSFFASFLLWKVYLHPGVPITHDGENHLARFANYKIALKEGQWPPRFAPNLFHRYGYPVFNYNYPLPSLLSVPFSLFKLPYQLIFKFIMVGAITLTVAGMWIWLKQLSFRFWPRVLGILGLLTSPYLIQTILFRGSIGEALALSCLIWLLVWVEWVRTRKERLLGIIIGTIVLALFFLSHNVTVLFGTPVLLIYALWRLGRTKKFVEILLSLVLAVGATLWFWLPAIAEQKEIIVGSSDLAQQYLNHFPTLQQLINSPLKFGYSYKGPIDSLAFALGAGQLFGLLCAGAIFIVEFIRKKKDKISPQMQIGGMLILSTFLCVIFQLAMTIPIWQLIPLARFIQFPWRLGLFTTITFAALIAWVAEQKIHWQVMGIVILLLVQISGIFRLEPVGYINKDRIEYELFEQSTTTSNENLPREFRYQDFSNWQPTPIVESGDASISDVTWTGTKRTYLIETFVPTTIIEPTMNFPGWKTVLIHPTSLKREAAEYINSQTIQGRIAYQLQPGMYRVTTTFGERTWPRLVGDMISLTSAICLLILIGRYFFGYAKRTQH
jgi:hypothetical protein